MEFKTLLYKRFQTDKNDNVILDLTKSSIDPTVHVGDRALFTVTKQYVMRPDLISLAFYGSENYADFIMKYNDISNPFSINEDDVLVIPNREQFEASLRIPNDESEPENGEIADFVVVPKSNVDKARLDALKQKAENKNVLPPNINDADEENIVITPDKIILGASVSGTCSTNSSRAKTKAALIQKYIKR